VLYQYSEIFLLFSLAFYCLLATFSSAVVALAFLSIVCFILVLVFDDSRSDLPALTPNGRVRSVHWTLG
jgi:hypothetical protein